jgi:iron-sulfur cluster assembly protein
MIEISPGAARRIRALMAKDGIVPGGGLRVGVKAGGCSGLSYIFSWESAPKPGDHVFRGPEDTVIFVDPKSLRFLDGTVLDCDTAMLGQTLLFKNPNAKSTCGCGTSFSV